VQLQGCNAPPFDPMSKTIEASNSATTLCADSGTSIRHRDFAGLMMSRGTISGTGLCRNKRYHWRNNAAYSGRDLVPYNT
jgi:hypothetical protein